jgi:hypothetical protein
MFILFLLLYFINNTLCLARVVPKGTLTNRRPAIATEDLNNTPPDSLAPSNHERQYSNDYADAQTAMNKSGYSMLQFQIDKQRKMSALMNTPINRKVKKNIMTVEPTDRDNFTDITKVRPKDLEPINFKSKINFEIPGTIPMQSNSKDIQRGNNHTTAFLYSKIANKVKIKKSNIISAVSEDAELELDAKKSSKFSLQHKSTASSLIASLGQRPKNRKIINSYPLKRKPLLNEKKDDLDTSPRIAEEKVNI